MIAVRFCAGPGRFSSGVEQESTSRPDSSTSHTMQRPSFGQHILQSATWAIPETRAKRYVVRSNLPGHIPEDAGCSGAQRRGNQPIPVTQSGRVGRDPRPIIAQLSPSSATSPALSSSPSSCDGSYPRPGGVGGSSMEGERNIILRDCGSDDQHSPGSSEMPPPATSDGSKSLTGVASASQEMQRPSTHVISPPPQSRQYVNSPIVGVPAMLSPVVLCHRSFRRAGSPRRANLATVQSVHRRQQLRQFGQSMFKLGNALPLEVALRVAVVQLVITTYQVRQLCARRRGRWP